MGSEAISPLWISLAIAAGYGVGLGLWFALTRAVPKWWVARRPLDFRHPWRELLWALGAAVAVFGLSIAYGQGRLIPQPAAGWGRTAVYLLNLLIIWSPVVGVLLLRRQSEATCLVSIRGLGRKLVWGLGAALIAMTAHQIVRGAPLAEIESTFSRWDSAIFVQGFLQFCGFGFLLVRIAGVAGRRGAALICGLLYGLVKYPYYLGSLGLGVGEATLWILVSSGVAMGAIYLVYDRQDMLVPAIVHTFMDLIQT